MGSRWIALTGSEIHRKGSDAGCSGQGAGGLDASTLCRWRVGVVAAVKRDQGPTVLALLVGLCVRCSRCRDTSVLFPWYLCPPWTSTVCRRSCQDCYWTVGRSVLVGNSMELHAEKKWLAIDGRLRTVPKDNRSFGLVWSLTRAQVVNPAVSHFCCLCKQSLPHHRPLKP